jgi:hypothetical protein
VVLQWWQGAAGLQLLPQQHVWRGQGLCARRQPCTTSPGLIRSWLLEGVEELGM